MTHAQLVDLAMKQPTDAVSAAFAAVKVRMKFRGSLDAALAAPTHDSTKVLREALGHVLKGESQ